jgi:hypothetical protein
VSFHSSCGLGAWTARREWGQRARTANANWPQSQPLPICHYRDTFLSGEGVDLLERAEAIDDVKGVNTFLRTAIGNASNSSSVVP